MVGIQERRKKIEQCFNCDDIIVPQPLGTIKIEEYRLIPIDMPNQLKEAMRNGRFFVDPRDSRGFRYHSLLDSYKRKKTEIYSAKKKERENIK